MYIPAKLLTVRWIIGNESFRGSSNISRRRFDGSEVVADKQQLIHRIVNNIVLVGYTSRKVQNHSILHIYHPVLRDLFVCRILLWAKIEVSPGTRI